MLKRLVYTALVGIVALPNPSRAQPCAWTSFVDHAFGSVSVQYSPNEADSVEMSVGCIRGSASFDTRMGLVRARVNTCASDARSVPCVLVTDYFVVEGGNPYVPMLVDVRLTTSGSAFDFWYYLGSTIQNYFFIGSTYDATASMTRSFQITPGQEFLFQYGLCARFWPGRPASDIVGRIRFEGLAPGQRVVSCRHYSQVPVGTTATPWSVVKKLYR